MYTVNDLWAHFYLIAVKLFSCYVSINFARVSALHDIFKTQKTKNKTEKKARHIKIYYYVECGTWYIGKPLLKLIKQTNGCQFFGSCWQTHMLINRKLNFKHKIEKKSFFFWCEFNKWITNWNKNTNQYRNYAD